MSIRVAIVGSGFAAIACAKALAGRGVKVILLDVGETLDAKSQRLRGELAAIPQAQWRAETIKAITKNPTVHGKALPLKYHFGSNYIYADERPFAPFEGGLSGAQSTFAKGGFSVAWGAAILPAVSKDIEDWPVTSADLEPHYRKALSWLPNASRKDGLQHDFPLLRDAAVNPLATSPEIVSLLDDMNRAQSGLEDRGIYHGHSRLAVETTGNAACTGCGLCLSGCPIGSIYSTEQDLDALIAKGGIEYVDGVHVEKFEESNGKVNVDMLDIDTGEVRQSSFDRLFVGAGSLNTTRLVLSSLERYDEPVKIAASQKFVVPLFRAFATPDTDAREHHVLSGAFIEMMDAAVSKYVVHLQISGPNPLIWQRFGIDMADPISWRRRLYGPVISRLMFALGGIHSNESDGIVAVLRPASPRNNQVLELSVEKRAISAKTVRLAARKLGREAIHFRSLAAPFLTKVFTPGSGSHHGGAFPMRTKPRLWHETDIFGRLQGHQRVHLIDSSIFPSVPGTTTALTIMANSHRIAAGASLE